MKQLKKALKLLGFIIILLLAATGIGISNALSSSNRERYSDNEIRIEQVDRKEDDDERKSEEEKH